ncbi:MAG: hypothetical protein JXM74_00325 [Fusobacteriaceae bacterium]|nr:hypothetical protein [Fusobacteriaceae bacterium]MBN2837182.1 hypothetical protein [Fusobacteriaceae bacterium]
MLTQNEIKETLEKFLVFKEKRIVDIYKSYVNLYRGGQNFSSAYNQIKSVNSLMDYSIFNNKIIEYIKKIDIYPYFSQPALVTFGDLTGGTSNRDITANSIDNFIKELEERIRRIEYILETINSLYTSNDLIKEELPTNNGLLTIKFQNDCNVTSLKELGNISKTWDILFKQFSYITGQTPLASIEFNGIRKGSLEIDFLNTVDFIKEFFHIYKFIIENMLIYWQFKEMFYKSNHLFSENMKKTMEEEKKNIDENCVNEVLKQMINSDKFIFSDKEQESKTISRVLMKLLLFIEQGGEIKLYTNAKTQEEHELEQLFQIIISKIEQQKNQNLANKNADVEKLN